LTHVEEVFRAEYGRVVAGLVRRFGDIDLAEEALADALLIALERGHATAYLPIRRPG
jgi:RNA polymerase sigma-70 factor (ECF subfamily)